MSELSSVLSSSRVILGKHLSSLSLGDCACSYTVDFMLPTHTRPSSLQMNSGEWGGPVNPVLRYLLRWRGIRRLRVTRRLAAFPAASRVAICTRVESLPLRASPPTPTASRIESVRR